MLRELKNVGLSDNEAKGILLGLFCFQFTVPVIVLIFNDR